MRCILRNCLLAAFALAGGLYAQTTPAVTVVPFSEAGVTFEPYDPATSPVFAKLFDDNPVLAPRKRYAAVVTNSSGKAILSMTFMLLRGDQPVYRNFLNGVHPPYPGMRPALPAGSRYLTLVGDGWEESRLAASPLRIESDQRKAVTARETQRIEGLAPTSIVLDIVIFEDLLVAGPDRSGTVADLLLQKQAAEEIGRDALAALDAGLDPAVILAQHAHGSTARDSLSTWKVRFSHQIVQLPTLRAKRAVAQQLLGFPDLSKLHRSQ